MGVKQSMQRLKRLERVRDSEIGKLPPDVSPVIIYDPNDRNDPDGHKAAAELRKRYPKVECLILLPEKEPHE